MAIKRKYAKKEDVPAELLKLYKENEKGEYILDAEEDEEGATRMSAALAKERKRAEDLDAKVKKWEASGKTPEEILELLEGQKAAADEKLKSEGAWTKLRDQLLEKHAKELKTRDDAMASLRSQLENLMVDSVAVGELATAKGKAKLLLPHIKSQTKVVEKDGKFSVVVVNAQGEPRINGKGEPLTIADVVKEMRESDDYASAFEGTGSGGSGTPPSGARGSKTVKRSEFDAMNPAQQREVLAAKTTLVD